MQAAFAAVWDDIQWLRKKHYPQLTGIVEALEVLEGLGLREGDVLAGTGAATADQVGSVLRWVLRSARGGRAGGEMQWLVGARAISS